jgi:hypothetical protein
LVVAAWCGNMARTRARVGEESPAGWWLERPSECGQRRRTGAAVRARLLHERPSAGTCVSTVGSLTVY